MHNKAFFILQSGIIFVWNYFDKKEEILLRQNKQKRLLGSSSEKMY